MTTSDKVIESILNHLFTNGAKQKADRLLLIKELHSGSAKVSDAEYLGGYSREAVRDMLKDALQAEESL
jgi:hypothetical protein